MSDRITARTEALALPWFSRSMKVTTAVVAAAFFVLQLRGLAGADPVAVLVSVVSAAVVALASATVFTTWLKMLGLVVRVPLSLYFYPE